METALLAVAIAAAALACPAHMWWQRRRGRHAACCAPRAISPAPLKAGARLGELRDRQAELAARIAQLEAQARRSSDASPVGGTRPN